MEQIRYYYEFIGQKYNLPISLCITSISNTLYHQSDYLELTYILKGTYIVNIGTEEYVLQSRSMAIIAPNEIHCFRKSKLSDDSAMLVVHISLDNIWFQLKDKSMRQFFSSVIGDKSSIIYNSLKSSLKSVFEIIIDGDEKKYSLLNLISFQILMAVYSNSQENLNVKKIESSDKDNYFKIINYLNTNYKRNIKLEDVANYLHFSTSYTSKFIKKYTGESFVKYLSRIRIRASLHDLISSDMTVLDIALKYGFANVKAYTMFFKEFYVVTPIAYRKRFKNNNEIGEYDIAGKVLEMTDEKYSLISHLFDINKTYVACVDDKPLCSVGKIVRSFIIRDIEFCIEPSNLIVIEDLTDIFKLDNIVIDCLRLTNTDYLRFGYGIMNILDFLAKKSIRVNITNTDSNIRQMLSQMIDMIHNRYENAHITYIDNMEIKCDTNFLTISDFVEAFKKNVALPIYVNKIKDDDIYLIDKYNFKSNHLFILAMINRMDGELILRDNGICVTRSGPKVKILLYYDIDKSEPDKKIFNISLQNIQGRFMETVYYVTEVLSEDNDWIKNDRQLMYNSKNRQYIKNKGKFGHSTEIVRCDGVYELKEELLQNQIKVIILNNL